MVGRTRSTKKWRYTKDDDITDDTRGYRTCTEVGGWSWRLSAVVSIPGETSINLVLCGALKS